MEYHTVVWRIFGSGHSPFTQPSAYELVKPVVNKRLPADKRRRAIVEISRWFAADREMLVPESEEIVATAILAGVGNIICQEDAGDDAHVAAWAVGSIDADRAARIMGASWTTEQIDSFVNVALEELKRLIEQEELFDPDHSARYAGTNGQTRITVDAAKLEGSLETFQYLDNRGLRLLDCIRDEATSLIRLVLAVRPDEFRAMIEQLGHPVLQACAAHHAVYDGRKTHYDRPLSWITRESCAAAIALAIVHSLKAVDRLDDAKAADVETQASDLVEGLVERLGSLDLVDCFRWIGELLSTAASYLSHGTNGDGIPHRVNQIENACIDLVAQRAGEAESDEVVNAFSAGLRTNRQRTWTRHLADLAWSLRDTMPAQSDDIARAALREYEGHVADHMSGRGSIHLHWNSWEHREWMLGIGGALALSNKEMELPEWVTGKCNRLPLSVWDVEEDYQAFSDAGNVARYWFLIAFLAIRVREELGCTVDPPEVIELVDLLWTHEAFMNRHIHHRMPEDELVAEHAARYAVEFGKPSDEWLIASIRHPGVTPRALWALIDQRNRRNDPVSATDRQHDGIIAADIRDIAGERFGDGRDYCIWELVFWGQLWLLFGAIDEAARTADALMAVPEAALGDGEKLMVLKLLALVASERSLTNEVEQYMQRLYRYLWPGAYTPRDERDDRSLIDEQLSSSFRRRRKV